MKTSPALIAFVLLLGFATTHGGIWSALHNRKQCFITLIKHIKIFVIFVFFSENVQILLAIQ